MKIINRYTLKQIIVGFVLVLVSMTVLVWLTQSLRMIDMIVTKGVPVKIFLELTVLVLPNFIQILSPLVLFAVALFTLIRMQADKELMVMQAVGMSPKNIMKPIFGLGVVLALLGYALAFGIIPASISEMREMKWKIKNDVSHLLLQEGQFNAVGNGFTLYIKERTKAGQVKGILAYESKKGDKVSVLSATRGTLFQEPDGIRVEFYDGSRQEYNRKTKQYSILKFDKYAMNFTDAEESGDRKMDVRELSLADLWNKTKADVKNNTPLWRKHKVELVKRLTQPIYNVTFLFLVMFGVLSGTYNRRGQAGRIYTTVFAALAVQSLSLVFENLSGKSLWWLILLVLNVFLPVFLASRGEVFVRRFCDFAALIFTSFARMKKIMVFLLIFGTSQTMAGVDIKIAPVNTKAPVDFEADKVSYNQKKNELNAKGNVVLTQDGMTVETDQITFNKTENVITAPEKIKIKTKDGTVAHTENGVLSGDLSSMKTGKTDVLFYEGSFMGAGTMERKENGDAYLTDAIYTPCDRCEGKAPLWQLHSKYVKDDMADHDLIFKHSFLEVKEVPVFYVPYFRIPDFTVKRRSGFLTPGWRSTREMKHAVSIPYFFDLADNQNLVVTPIISPDHFPMGLADYQGAFSEGELNIKLSGTENRGSREKEGHIKAGFRYDITEDWKLSGELYKVSTDTYFRRYKLPGVDDSDPFLTSHLTAERFGNRNYFRFKTYSFQSLQDGVASESIPILLPVMDYQYNTMPLTDNGLYAYTNVNTMMFNNREHFKSNRISMTEGLRIPYIGFGGLAMDMEGYVRADGYAVDTGKYPFSDRKANETYNTGRFYPNFSTTARYPFVRNDEDSTQIFEPVVMFVASGNGGNDEKIPNVDSLVFDFDDTDLFSTNRFSGYDRVEPGQRINYGLKWSLFNHKKKQSIQAMVGQSYRFDDDELMAGLMGYDSSHFSNYVGRVQISIPYVNFFYRARLEQKTLQAQKNEIGFTAGAAPLKAGVSYVMRKAYQIGDNRYGAREEIVYRASSQLTKSLNLSGSYRYDLSGKGEPVKYAASLRYDNECTAIIIDMEKSFTKDRDFKGSFSLMAKVVLKTLGGM